jgi:hypothetical protein
MLIDFLIMAALILLAGAANAVMDSLQFHYEKSIFPLGPNDKLLGKKRHWWDPRVSWRNKYKDGISSRGPAFLGSTTVFVSITDAWHLAQEIMLAAFALAIAWPIARDMKWWGILLVFLAVRVLFGTTFNIFYYKTLKK